MESLHKKNTVFLFFKLVNMNDNCLFTYQNNKFQKSTKAGATFQLKRGQRLRPGPGFYNHGSTFGYRSTWHTAGPAGHPAPPVPFAPPLAAPATPKVAIAAA